jgi:hypothetical protein
VQIIHIDKDNNLVFRRERLEFALSGVPPSMKVAVVSVVGGFRTGKSFLLDLFLRYLRAGAPSEEGDESWLWSGGEHLEGNAADPKAPEFVAVAGRAAGGEGGGEGGGGGQAPPAAYPGFKWRAGRDRETVGMWLWNKAFVLPLPGHAEEKVAVLLMDTQGLHDTLTNASQTAQLFGLATLISSYQIYNVKEKVDEQDLSSVATFSAYARSATDLKAQQVLKSPLGAGEAAAAMSAGGTHTPPPPPPAAAALHAPPLPLGPRDAPRDSVAAPASGAPPPVFQRLEFLVRDAHFPLPSDWDDAGVAEGHMGAYFRGVMDQERRRGEDMRELRETRRAVLSCFSALSCFMLPSPGETVAGHGEELFTGRVSQIRNKFRTTVARYARTVFTQQLEAKRLFLGDGEEVTARELTQFVTECCSVFQDSAVRGQLPEIPMLLTATANAHLRLARDRATAYLRDVLSVYREAGAAYVAPGDLSEALEASLSAALALFSKRANFGDKARIEAARGEVEAELRALVSGAKELNAAREPRVAVGLLLALLWVALSIAQGMLDMVCSPWLGLCASLSTVLLYGNRALLFLVPYYLYVGALPGVVVESVGQGVALARAHSHALPPLLADFVRGPLLGGVGAGGSVAAFGSATAAGVAGAAAAAAAVAGAAAAAATSTKLSSGGGAGGAGSAAATASGTAGTEESTGDVGSPGYNGGALRGSRKRNINARL